MKWGPRVRAESRVDKHKHPKDNIRRTVLKIIAKCLRKVFVFYLLHHVWYDGKKGKRKFEDSRNANKATNCMLKLISSSNLNARIIVYCKVF